VADGLRAELIYARTMTAVKISGQRRAARWGNLAADEALAAVLAVVLPVVSYVAARHQPGHRPFDAGAFALVTASAVVLAWRQRYPLAVLALAFAITFSYFVIGYADGPIWLALLIAYFTAATRGHRMAAAIAAVAGFGFLPWLDYLLRNGPIPSMVGLAALANATKAAGLASLGAVLLVVLGAGEIARIRRERSAAAARFQEEEARRRATEERLRIARELHDSLGHYLSLISVQSGVALNLNQHLPEQARSSLAAVKQASKDALGELRSVLEILRKDADSAPQSPAPALNRLDDLVAHASAPGLEVRAEIEGGVRRLPFGVDAAGYRIVQEALTNVTRHAGPGTATVRVTYGEEDLTVQVDDDGRGPAGHQRASGNGISGMRERVSALGGQFYAGPRPGGGFRIRAQLPVNGGR
jgi:signal transduction histidine kinase